MLTRFSGNNYKAFEDFSLEVKPLTILLGANSCGKSAILNSFLMLSQSIETSSQTDTPFRLNGSRVGMGESLNLIKDKNKKNKLGFSFEFNDLSSVEKIISNIKRDCLDAHFAFIRHTYQLLRRVDAHSSSMTQLIEELDSMYFETDDFTEEHHVKITKMVCSFIKIYRSNKEKIDNNRNDSLSKSITTYFNKVSLKKIEDCIVGLIQISSMKLTAKKISMEFGYNKKDDYLYISKVVLENEENEVIIDIDIDSHHDVFLNSDIINIDRLRRSRSEFKKLMDFKSLVLCDEREDLRFLSFQYFSQSQNPFAIYLSRMIFASLNELKESFIGLNINHVSPLRAFPQRYYLLDKAVYHNKLNSLDGIELAEVLKNNPQIKDEINILLAEFKIAIEIEKVNDIIHKISVNQDAVYLELTDVGFGISQVLPILVQAYLSPKNSITIIEQPEIHLHPKMQAWLTDALIKIAINESKRFIIETHSEALVRRIRLRIVDDESLLNEDHVAIYYLEKNKIDYKTEMKNVTIDPDGDISWPSEFMDVEINDTIAIQKKKLERIMKRNEGL